MADHLGEQAWHADGPHEVFPATAAESAAAALGGQLPPHALTVFFPLVDVTDENGPTEFALGSHRPGHEYDAADAADEAAAGAPPRAPICARAGSAVVFDYRTWHRGLPNRSMADRPVLYAVVSRPWWKDPRNYNQSASLFARAPPRPGSGSASRARERPPAAPPAPLAPARIPIGGGA